MWILQPARPGRDLRAGAGRRPFDDEEQAVALANGTRTDWLARLDA
jgi:hypothetical protein